MRKTPPLRFPTVLDWLLPAETAGEENTETLMPLAESDVRAVAPDDEADSVKGRSEQGRELTGILLALFLLLLLVELWESRYVE